MKKKTEQKITSKQDLKTRKYSKNIRRKVIIINFRLMIIIKNILSQGFIIYLKKKINIDLYSWIPIVKPIISVHWGSLLLKTILDLCFYDHYEEVVKNQY